MYTIFVFAIKVKVYFLIFIIATFPQNNVCPKKQCVDCVVNVIKNKSFNEVKNLNFQVLRKIMDPVDKKPITAEIIITET